MKTKDEILRTIKSEFPKLNEKYGVKKIGLFGSYSRGEQTKHSDVDLLVEFERPIGFFKFIELEDYLTEKLKVKVELVTDDALKPLVKPHVMEDVIYV
ncbi:MAG: nucleotidyltransferase family protein [Deltaproteobacteria bacterium]|nr:nucleotidyltransferase family protein [Deltaproteobacteria bacterium]MCL5277621.1 nucleotidyltransferase family protein [Deltaproteobacteria bacterium]